MEVGQKLFAARQRRGLTLEDLTRTTKIPMALLEAIERDDAAHLPQGFFTRAFVRTFAVEVGLDPEDLLHTFDRLDDEEVTEVEAPVPIQEPPASRRFVFAMALAGACAMFYAGYMSRPLMHPPAGNETPETIRSETIALVVPPCASISALPATIGPETRTTTVVRSSAVVPGTISVNEVVPISRPETKDTVVDTAPAVSDAIAPLPDAALSPATVQ